MSIHFAAARRVAASPVARVLSRRAVGWPANDDAVGDFGDSPDAAASGEGFAGTVGLEAALRHFGEHGLRAAPIALIRATAARDSGDAQGFAHWRGICRLLDPRLALALEGDASPISPFPAEKPR